MCVCVCVGGRAGNSDDSEERSDLAEQMDDLPSRCYQSKSL